MSGGSGYLANGRPASLPSSVGTSPNTTAGNRGKDFFPFDPHCVQCLSEWRHLAFSYPGPTPQGFQYADVSQQQVDIAGSQEISMPVPSEGYPPFLKRQPKLQRQSSFEQSRRVGCFDLTSLM